MGLGAQKRRSKLSHDPNNTAWARDTDTYGHRILSRQGWQPGSYLGATDAAHADHYTAANASHVRVFLREENLGLGAQVGKTNAETFGLSLFSGVLGRLNGKSEQEVAKHQNALRDVELRTYQERKYGVVGFVRGGFLVGDRIQETVPGDDSMVSAREATGEASKKRRAEDETFVLDSAASTKKKHKTNRIKSDEYSSTSAQDEEEITSSGRKEKKRKDKHNKKSKAEKDDVEDSSTRTSATEDERTARKRERQEKRARKEERRRRKEEKANRKPKRSTSQSRAEDSDGSDTPASPSETQPSRPSSTAPSMSGRQAVRQRYIQQKRMASMDPQAMKEIFMVSTAG